jgi:hypothetical protein
MFARVNTDTIIEIIRAYCESKQLEDPHVVWTHDLDFKSYNWDFKRGEHSATAHILYLIKEHYDNE